MGRKNKNYGNLTEKDILDFAESEHPDIKEIAKNLTQYDLTFKQRMVLAVKLLPQAALWSEGKKIRMAEVHTGYYYYLLKSPKFRKVLVQATIDMKCHHLPEIWNAYKVRALFGIDGRQACERILEDAGILEKSKPDAQPAPITNIGITIQDRNEKRKEILNRFNITVDDNGGNNDTDSQ